nr:hypothetical protein [Janibacter limosus]
MIIVGDILAPGGTSLRLGPRQGNTRDDDGPRRMSSGARRRAV